MKRKVSLHYIPKILWICTIVTAVICVASGIYCLVSYVERNRWTNLDQITFTKESADESATIEFTDLDIFPGTSETFKVNIKSNLHETVKYSISFSDHELEDDDKSLYVSINNVNEEPLMNNTLYEIYDESLAIGNQTITSFSEDTLTFTFSLSQLYEKEEHLFDFKITIQAEGKIIYG